MKHLYSIFYALFLIILFFGLTAKTGFAQGLSGSYTVDTAGSGDFDSISAAANALNQKGVSGPVTINIKPGTYHESVKLDSIKGVNAQNTITFQSSTQDTEDVSIIQQGSRDSMVIFTLHKSDYLVFQKLTFKTQTSNQRRLFHNFRILDGVTHVTIKDCQFISLAFSSREIIVAEYENYQQLNPSHDITLKNNTIKGGDIEFSGRFGSSYDTNFSMRSIHFRRNHFKPVAPQYGGMLGQSISVNKIKNLNIKSNSFNASMSDAIAIYASKDVEIIGNKVYGSYGGGFVFGSVDPIKSNFLVANNFIQVFQRAIDFDGSAKGLSGKFYHNNCLTKAKNSSTVRIFDKCIYKNNIFANKKGFAVYIIDTLSFTSDHNNYYSGSDNIAFIETKGFSNPPDTFGLSQIQQQYGTDQNSLTVKPGFVSDSNLHITNDSLQGKGTAINQITTDIDGDQRDSQNPDIGADELEATPDLVVTKASLSPDSITSSSAFKVNWTVRNKGSLPVKTPWKDGVYLSRDQKLDKKRDYYLGSKQINADLPFGKTYSQQLSTTFPYEDSAGQFYVLVFPNDSGTTDHRSNNLYPIKNPLKVNIGDLPDLEITQITAPQSINSGEELQLFYEVKNTGQNITSGKWKDKFYIGSDSSALRNALARPNDSLVLVEETNKAPISLKPGQSYQATVTLQFPLRFSGQYYVKGFTDHKDKVHEVNETSFNTEISSSFKVNQTPLPDLKITQINVDQRYFSGGYAKFNYTIQNAGSDKIDAAGWKDQVKLLNATKEDETELGTINNSKPLKPGQKLQVFDSFRMPACVSDTFQFQIGTDLNRKVTELVEANNGRLSDTFKLILKPKPDLQIEDVSVLSKNPATEQSDVKVEVKVKNDGNTKYEYGVDGRLYNGLYLSKDAKLELDKDRFLKLKPLNKDISAGGTVKDMLSFRMPADVPGKYYMHAVTDKNDQVCEVPFEDNNKGRTSGQIDIQLAPPKDLTPANVSFNPKDRKTGEQINLTATIKNQKPGTIDFYEWEDKVYLVSVNDGDSVRLKSRRRTFTLNGNDQYQLKATFNLPLRLTEGNYYLAIVTDYQDAVYEHQAEGNNAYNSSQFRIERDSNAVSDLTVTSISINNSPKAGNKLKFSYTTKNASQKATASNGWINKVSLINASGVPISSKEILHFGKLDSKQSQSTSAEIEIPEGKSGNYILKVEADTKQKIFEYNTQNNTQKKQVPVQQSPWADLDVSIQQIPNQARSGQQINFQYTLDNKGTGAIQQKTWVDHIYLSKDEIIDEDDPKITEVKHVNQDLKTNNTLTRQIDTILPRYVSGDYYIIVKADASKQIFEQTKVTNNIAISSNQVDVKQALPADLTVQNVNILSQKNESLTFEAEVLNKGPNDIRGNWYYSAFLSDDQKLDLKRPVKTDSTAIKQILANSFKRIQVTLDYPTVKPGYYHVLLRLDNFNQIPETDERNNTYLLKDSFQIQLIDTLVVDQPKQGQYKIGGGNAEKVYYQMDVGKDTGIYLKLRPNDQNLATQLFTKTGAIPDPLNYDHKHNNPYNANQDLIIPSQDSFRSDYIMTRSTYLPGNKLTYPFTITAESKTFSIEEVDPVDGSNYGMIVMGIYGFDFNDQTQFMLQSQDQSDTIKPIQKAVISSTEGRAHFDLRDRSPGQYDVVAVKPGATTRLNQGFEVLDTGLRDLKAEVTTPSRRLVGDKAYPKVFASNKGEINAYDVSLNVIFYGDSLTKDDLNVRFNGSDAIYQGDNLNPPGTGNIIDSAGIKVYSVYYPVMPSSSTTTFTFEMTAKQEAKVNVEAFWTHHPKTDWAFSGDVDDLASSRFLQVYDSIIARQLGKLKYDRGKLDNCSEDLKIENMEETVLKELGKQALRIHPFNPVAAGKRKIAGEVIKGAINKRGLNYADEFAQTARKALKAKHKNEKLWGLVEDPNYKKQVKFVFSCIKNNKKYQKKILGPCLKKNETGLDNNYVIEDDCNNNDNSGGNGNGENNFTEYVESIDPNEIIGPSGFTALKLVKPGKTMNYDILFENKPTATSPAQKVKITNPLPENANVKSFQLEKFGFGDTTFDLPAQQRTTQQYTLGSGNDRVIVKIKAGVDPVNREAFWTLSTIDPETGLPPKDPSRGFLPPNDSTGRGEGFVSYQINARENLNHGDSVTNHANIIFDDNAPIQTNTWINLIATDPLKSKILQDYQKVDSTSVVLQWKQVTQEPFSTEVSGYNLYVSKDDNNYERWLSGIPDEKARFTGEPGETYYFISQAIGVNGKTEPIKNNYEVKVTFDSSGNVDAIEEPSRKMLKEGKQVQVYPNPSNNVTNVRFKLKKAQHVNLKLVNSQGKVMNTLKNRYFMAGSHQFRFNPEKLNLKAGAYLLTMRGAFTQTVTKWIYMK